MKKLVILLLSCSVFGCKSEPEHFSTNLAGFLIHFPLIASELDTTKFSMPLCSSKYVDSTDAALLMWLFDTTQDGKDTVHKIPDRCQAYGVNIYLKNKGNQLDSVKTALEKQFGKTLLPVTITEILGECYDNNPEYSCQLNSNTTLFLRKATCNQGDSWCQENSIRIGIGYNLEKDQLEWLAVSDSKIHKDYD